MYEHRLKKTDYILASSYDAIDNDMAQEIKDLMAQRVKVCISLLKPRSRLYLSDLLQGLTIAQIARKHKKTHATVKERIHGRKGVLGAIQTLQRILYKDELFLQYCEWLKTHNRIQDTEQASTSFMEILNDY